MSLHNLPKQLTPFVGRENEIAGIIASLEDTDCRLLSLIGAGGMGKTRLAIEIAERKASDFTDGIVFVALHIIDTPEYIVHLIASALNFEFYDDSKHLKEQLLNYLSDKNLLLIMDNFEHLLDGADLIADILVHAPQVKIIVTSREALKIQQEWIRPVTGMSFPDTPQAGELESYSALTLFAERAQQFRKDFDIHEELPHIIRICQLVGGMPLGIELAVAWLKTLSCAEIATEIEKNFDLLTAQMRDMAERHQSIRVIFDATWQMLDEEERAVFMRLSVFRDIPTRNAIQSVTNASLLTLSSLADKTLLIPTEDGRYQIHELLRQYAYEKLEASEECEEIKSCHSEYYLHFLKGLQGDLHGRRQIESVEEISLDFENVRLAWSRAIEQRNEAGIASAVETLCSYLHFRSIWKQESHMITAAEERFAPQSGEEPSLLWAMLAARNYTNHDDPEAILLQALEIAEAHQNSAEQGLYRLLLGFVYGSKRNPADRMQYLKDSIPHFEIAGDKYHLAAAYAHVGMVYRLTGDYDSALTYNEQGLTIARNTGDLDGQTLAIAELSNTKFILGYLKKAEQYRMEAILLAEQIGRLWSIVWQKWELAIFHYFGVQGDLEKAKSFIQDNQYLTEVTSYKGNLVSITLPESLFAGMEGNYEDAYAYGEQAMQIGEGDAWEPMFAWGLMVALAGQRDYEALRDYNNHLLDHFGRLRVIPFVLLGTAFEAILLAYDDRNPRRATELLALTSTHSGSMSGWLKLWGLISTLKDDLEHQLGTAAYQSAWDYGTTLAWDSVLSEYSDYDDVSDENGVIPVYVLEANARLIDPLSDRELEVLLKIGEGHTNREIADELFVGVSTVKKHITHIYSKLQVESRTQALLRAQEANLISPPSTV